MKYAMNRNYRTTRDFGHDAISMWASSRETHPAVATAIHAIADSSRAPEAIWADPTAAELDHVKMAVEEYVRLGDYPFEPDGYCWGSGDPVIVEMAA